MELVEHKVETITKYRYPVSESAVSEALTHAFTKGVKRVNGRYPISILVTVLAHHLQLPTTSYSAFRNTEDHLRNLVCRWINGQDAAGKLMLQFYPAPCGWCWNCKYHPAEENCRKPRFDEAVVTLIT